MRPKCIGQFVVTLLAQTAIRLQPRKEPTKLQSLSQMGLPDGMCLLRGFLSLDVQVGSTFQNDDV
jgi:hypothetical protein